MTGPLPMALGIFFAWLIEFLVELILMLIKSDTYLEVDSFYLSFT